MSTITFSLNIEELTVMRNLLLHAVNMKWESKGKLPLRTGDEKTMSLTRRAKVKPSN